MLQIELKNYFITYFFEIIFKHFYVVKKIHYIGTPV
jgi:hypothetical protein